MTESLTMAQCVTLACLLEATAPKPGNVHRGADFEDLTFTDFLVSAAVVGPCVARAETRGVGQAVLDGVRATRRYVGTNTNLGILLVLAPLAAVPRHEPLGTGLPRVLARLTPDDAARVYEAIRLASPGGLGESDRHDVHAEPPADLLDAMRFASPRDAIARQYVESFSTVLDRAAPWLIEARRRGWSLNDAIVHTHVRLLADEPDSLIRRKCGESMANTVAARARDVLRLGGPSDAPYRAALADLDFFLRCDGHRRNPGTTADLIAGALFALLREGELGGTLDEGRIT
ncbi:MAG: triphosphoribosyl-dephospho-CoA synthetase [Planctomycetes bacterium]|nr:triphosphoribosyl-dephospho-CoA synthetase [Planctomycetota bacterium]